MFILKLFVCQEYYSKYIINYFYYECMLMTKSNLFHIDFGNTSLVPMSRYELQYKIVLLKFVIQYVTEVVLC